MHGKVTTPKIGRGRHAGGRRVISSRRLWLGVTGIERNVIMLTATHHRLIARSGHCLHFERLELRTLLSVSSEGIQEPFAQGELLIGFEGEVPEMLGTRGPSVRLIWRWTSLVQRGYIPAASFTIYPLARTRQLVWRPIGSLRQRSTCKMWRCSSLSCRASHMLSPTRS